MENIEEYFLSYKETNSIDEQFYRFRNIGFLVDTTLIAEHQFTKAHRLVLCATSQYFRRLFERMHSSQEAVVHFNNVSFRTLWELIKFIYCGNIKIRSDSLRSFLKAAKNLEIKGFNDYEELSRLINVRKYVPFPQPRRGTVDQTAIITPEMFTEATQNNGMPNTEDNIEMEVEQNAVETIPNFQTNRVEAETNQITTTIQGSAHDKCDELGDQNETPNNANELSEEFCLGSCDEIHTSDDYEEFEELQLSDCSYESNDVDVP